MNKVYQRIKGKTLTYGSYSGVVCGYCDGKFILATLQNPPCSFRRMDAKTDAFVEEEYRASEYKYVYCNEWDVYKQHPRMKRI